jgi:hypothetical protein
MHPQACILIRCCDSNVHSFRCPGHIPNLSVALESVLVACLHDDIMRSAALMWRDGDARFHHMAVGMAGAPPGALVSRRFCSCSCMLPCHDCDVLPLRA